MKTHLNLSPAFWRTSRSLALIVCLGFCAASCAAQMETDDGAVVQSYVPPSWAPPYDNVSTIRYYYMPDYEMYYDVWDHQFWYQGPDGQWAFSDGPPPPLVGVDLSGCFFVLIDRDRNRPWMDHDYYRQNYPRHGYDNYTDIVVHNRIVTNIQPGHQLVPRAFNENNNRVTFMQRPVRPQEPPHDMGDSRSGQSSPGGPHPGGKPMGDQQPPPPVQYHHVVHEVPMKSISPSMPPASRGLNYGRGYTKGSVPPRGAAPSKGGGGGGKR